MINFRQRFRGLFKNKNAQDFPAGYMPAKFIQGCIKEKIPEVLIIGDFDGADYETLSPLADKVTVVDIVDNGVIPKADLVLADASDLSCFENDRFNLVIIRNVLEHLYSDYDCLLEIRRVLRPQGRLIVDTPYLFDEPDVHVRTYTPTCMRRMLLNSGFKCLKSEYRGLVQGLSNNLIAVFSLMLYPIAGEQSIKVVNGFIYSVSRLFKSSKVANRFFIHYGEFLELESIPGEAPDPRRIQTSTFLKGQS